MTSYLYAIADVGGNIYPGTFSKTRDLAIDSLVWQSMRWSDPRVTTLGVAEYQAQWEERVKHGDHVVFCRIDTNEQICVTMEDIPDDPEAQIKEDRKMNDCQRMADIQDLVVDSNHV